MIAVTTKTTMDQVVKVVAAVRLQSLIKAQVQAQVQVELQPKYQVVSLTATRMEHNKSLIQLNSEHVDFMQMAKKLILMGSLRGVHKLATHNKCVWHS